MKRQAQQSATDDEMLAATRAEHARLRAEYDAIAPHFVGLDVADINALVAFNTAGLTPDQVRALADDR